VRVLISHKMKCKNCGKEFEPKSRLHIYCNVKCNWEFQHKKNYPIIKDKKIKRARERYYQNREKILKQQIKRLNKKYKEDKEFRKKDNFRKHTAHKFSLKGKKCEMCGTTIDLQRHHINDTNYKDFMIFCRKCHNTLHFG